MEAYDRAHVDSVQFIAFNSASQRACGAWRMCYPARQETIRVAEKLRHLNLTQRATMTGRNSCSRRLSRSRR